MQSPSVSPSSNTPPAQVSSPAKKKLEQSVEKTATDAGAAGQATDVDSVETRRAKTNAATLQAHLNVSLGTKDNPLALTYKAALEGINEALEPTMGPNAAEKIQESGIDVSPEATSERIVSFATSFFSRYQEQNQDMSLADQVDSFISLVGGGVDKGFGEAREILDGLGVLEGDLEADINRTYELVFEGFEKFREEKLQPETDGDEVI